MSPEPMRLTAMESAVLLALLPTENPDVPGTVRAECQDMDELEHNLPGCRPAANALHRAGLVRTRTDYRGGWGWSITSAGKRAIVGTEDV